jgi:mutator protein MutT
VRTLRTRILEVTMQREFPEMPLMGVGAIIVNDEGRVLLAQRGHEPLKGHWSIPGGLVELGETLDEALRRETREESGLEIENLGLVELLDRIYREENRVRYHYVIADYLCRPVAGTARAGDDAVAIHWATPEECAPGGPFRLDPIAARVIAKALSMHAKDRPARKEKA